MKSSIEYENGSREGTCPWRSYVPLELDLLISAPGTPHPITSLAFLDAIDGLRPESEVLSSANVLYPCSLRTHLNA